MYGDDASDIFGDSNDNHGLALGVHETYGEEYHQLQRERRARKHSHQWNKWMHNVIPSLIGTYFQLLQETASLRNDPVVQPCCACASLARALKIDCIHFNCEFYAFHL